LTVPKNATSSYSSNDFICKNNYYRNSTKTGCLPVPKNATSSGVSNNFFCNSGYERKGNSCNKIYNWKLIIGVIVFILWLITRKKKTKPPKPKKPSKPSSPRGQSTPKAPRRKARSTNIKDPRSLLIELGVAIAYVDGQFVDDEGYALKNQIQKMVNKSGDSEKHKKLFNDTFLRAHNDGKNNKLSFKDICLNLYTKGNKELSLEALKIAYEIMGSDGHIHDKEAEMINYISTQLKISSAIQEDIRDDFFVRTVIKKDFNILNLLGLSVSASKHEKCKALTKEFSKWNSRSNMLKNETHRENAQKILKQIGIASRKNNC
jgi:tellurite resistance protein